MSPPRVIETARLRLRPPAMSDAPAIFESYATDLDVTRYLLWPPHRDLSDTQAYLSLASGAWAQAAPTDLAWVLERKDDARLLGMVGAKGMTPGGTSVEVGYVLARPFWGDGYTTEATRAVVDALIAAGFWRVWASCHVDNPASARVLEKAGLAFEGVLRRFLVFPNLADTPQDCRMYARVRDAAPEVPR